MDQDENPNNNYGNERVQTPANPSLGYGSSLLETQAVYSARENKSEPAPSQLRQAQTLMISDGTQQVDLKFMPIFAKHTLKIQSQDLLFVNSWNEFVTKLQQYQSIEKLVLFTHGIPGGVGIGGVFKDLGEIAGLFTGRPTPKIKEINFEGCNIAEFSDPHNVDGLVKFVETLSTSKFSAWNKFHIIAEASINIPPNSSVAIIQRILATFEGYLLVGTPTATELFNLGGNQPFGLEWFRTDLNEDPLPRPDPEKRRSFLKRAAATQISIRGTKQVVKQGLMDKWNTYKNQPITPFERIVGEIT